jgi:hypothetical protein
MIFGYARVSTDGQSVAVQEQQATPRRLRNDPRHRRASLPSVDHIERFLGSPDYAPYRAARIAATESNLFAFENDPDAPQFKEA